MYIHGVVVDCGELLKQVLVSGSSLAAKMRPFTESNMMSVYITFWGLYTCTAYMECSIVVS